MKCPLCGYLFEKGKRACVSCSLSKNCGTQCPNCGYMLSPEPMLPKFFKKIRRWSDGPKQ